MFKTSGFEKELMQEMSKKLIENETENVYSYNKISKAADYLNAAAEIFDDTGMHKEAEMITRMLESLGQAPMGEDLWRYSQEMGGNKVTTPSATSSQPSVDWQTPMPEFTSQQAQALINQHFNTPNNPVALALKAKQAGQPIKNLQQVHQTIDSSRLTPLQKHDFRTMLGIVSQIDKPQTSMDLTKGYQYKAAPPKIQHGLIGTDVPGKFNVKVPLTNVQPKTASSSKKKL